MPTLRENAHFKIFGPVQEDGRSIREVFESMIKPPMFPVSVSNLPGEFVFHDVGDADFTVGDMVVKSRLIPHVGNTLGYRVSYGGLSVSYLSDHQMPVDGSMGITAGARELCQGVDVLIHDAQYTPQEFAERSTWGHCTIDYAVWVAIECQVKKLVLFHHDPKRSDDELDGLLFEAQRRAEPHGIEVLAAHEGQTLAVPLP
jgi:phosphoribosyl 1,2-cyclic phosphodiesterase